MIYALLTTESSWALAVVSLILYSKKGFVLSTGSLTTLVYMGVNFEDYARIQDSATDFLLSFFRITSVKDKWPLILTIFFVDILQILRFKFLKIRILVWFILMFYVTVNSYCHVVACKLRTFTHRHFPSWEGFDTCTFTDMHIH